jgi:hypothetical protein
MPGLYRQKGTLSVQKRLGEEIWVLRTRNYKGLTVLTGCAQAAIKSYFLPLGCPAEPEGPPGQM